MAGKTAAELLIPGESSFVAVAPVGTTMPSTLTNLATPPSPWVHLGFIEDPPELGFDREVSNLTAWNSGGKPVVSSTTSDTTTLTLSLPQVNNETLQMAFRGGTFTTFDTTGVLFVPGTTDAERAVILGLIDGTKKRYVRIQRAGVGEIESITFDNDTLGGVTMTLTVLAPSSGNAIDQVFAGMSGVTAS